MTVYSGTYDANDNAVVTDNERDRKIGAKRIKLG